MSELRKILEASSPAVDPSAEIEKQAKRAGATTSSTGGKTTIKPSGSDITIVAYYANKPATLEVIAPSIRGPLVRRNYGSVDRMVEDIYRMALSYKGASSLGVQFSQNMGTVERKIGRKWKFGKRTVGKRYTASRKGYDLRIELVTNGQVEISLMGPGKTGPTAILKKSGPVTTLETLVDAVIAQSGVD